MPKCRGCGREVHFAKDGAGKVQILDAVAPVYRLITDEQLSDGADGVVLQQREEPIADRALGYYVTHFATCPKANEFSKGKRHDSA